MKDKQFRAAKIRANSFDEDTNTVSIVWTTGAAVRRADWNGDEYDEVLSLDESAVRLARLNNGAPFLNVHSSESLGDVIGKVVEGSAKIEDGRGVAAIRLSSAPSDADTIQKIRDGIIRNVSVGYQIWHSTRQAGEDGQPDTVLIDDWEPLELSAVPVPADPGAQIRKHGGNPSQPLSRRERRFRNGAAEATRLLQATRTSAEARGASEARKVLGTMGRIAPVPKVGKIANRDIEAGAREARRLLRGRQ